MPAQKTYNPADVTLSVGGKQISGYANGTFLKIERDEDSWAKDTGADGETCRTKSNNRGGKITFTLMQSSASNQVLSALAALDEISGGGAVPVMVRDNSPGGKSLYFCEQGWILKPANSEFSKSATTREWVIDTGNLIVNVGGN
jgi:hypothetical protein